MSSTEHKELKSGRKNEVEVKTIGAEEVRRHNTKKDLWMTIHGKVYNLTEYARDHPGGLDTLLEVAGTDATGAFEDVGHSQDAREILHSFLVGVLEGAEPEASQDDKPASAPPSVQVIRRSDAPDHSTSILEKLMNPRTELAAFAVGTTGLVWVVNRYHLINHLQIGHGSFTQGFVLACITAGVVGFVSLRYLEKMISTPGFTTYVPHVQSSVAKRGAFHPAGVIAPQEYRKFKLRQKKELSDGIWRFVFDLPSKYSVLGLPIGQHVAIKGAIDGHTVVRSYTPVSNNRDLGRLELLIRVYDKGQLGNYLKDLSVGDEAEIRGPKGAMRYRKGMIKSIGMVAGGTGITPMFQLIRAICEDDSDDTKVSLIYANRSEEDIMLREKLDGFARTASNKFKLHYVLDKPSPGWTGGKGYVTKDLLAERMPKAAPDTKMMLCGPPPMVNAMKKNLVQLGFEEPGAVGKMSDQIFCF